MTQFHRVMGGIVIYDRHPERTRRTCFSLRVNLYNDGASSVQCMRRKGGILQAVP